MMNLFLAANSGKAYVNLIVKCTNDNDLRIAEYVCVAGVAAIFIICVTIYLLMRLSYKKEEKSVKRILKDLLKNDKSITALLKKTTTSSNTEEAVKEVLNEMVDKEV